jgi:hypothetical protein
MHSGVRGWHAAAWAHVPSFSTAENTPDAKEYMVQYDFELMQAGEGTQAGGASALRLMVTQKEGRLLLHPLVNAYLAVKWNKVLHSFLGGTGVLLLPLVTRSRVHVSKVWRHGLLHQLDLLRPLCCLGDGKGCVERLLAGQRSAKSFGPRARAGICSGQQH